MNLGIAVSSKTFHFVVAEEIAQWVKYLLLSPAAWTRDSQVEGESQRAP